MQEKSLSEPDASKEVGMPGPKPATRPAPPGSHGSAEANESVNSVDSESSAWASVWQATTQACRWLTVKSSVVLAATTRFLVGRELAVVLRKVALIMLIVAVAVALLHALYVQSGDGAVRFGRFLVILIRETLVLWLMAMIAAVVTLNLVRRR